MKRALEQFETLSVMVIQRQITTFRIFANFVLQFPSNFQIPTTQTVNSLPREFEQWFLLTNLLFSVTRVRQDQSLVEKNYQRDENCISDCLGDFRSFKKPQVSATVNFDNQSLTSHF